MTAPCLGSSRPRLRFAALCWLLLAAPACSGRSFTLEQSPGGGGGSAQLPDHGFALGGTNDFSPAPVLGGGTRDVPSRLLWPAAGEGGVSGSPEQPPTAGGAGGTPGRLELVYADFGQTVVRGHVDTETDITRDLCPESSVLVGVQGQVNSDVVGQLQGSCKSLGLSDDESPTLQLGASTSTPLRGGAAGETIAAECPPEHVVVGFQGRNGLLLDQLQLHCAPLLVVDGSVVLGATRATAAVGGNGGTAFEPTFCAAGSVAAGALVRADYWLRGFGLPCVKVDVRVGSP